MTHSDNWYVEIPEHSDEWYENRYDHKYLGQEGMRELIRIIKLHIAELDKELHDGLDGHEERINEIEQRLANVVGSSEPVKLEDFVADTLARLDVAEARLDGIDDRFDNFAESSESSETFSIEQVIDAIISQVNDIEEHLEDVDTVEIGSEVLTVQEVVDRFLEKFDELDSEDESLSDRIEELSDRAIQSIEYNGEEYLPTSNIFVQPQPEDKEEVDIAQDSEDGIYVGKVGSADHIMMKALLNDLAIKKELDRVDINYDFTALILDDSHALNEYGFDCQVLVKRDDSEITIAQISGVPSGTDAAERYDVTDWFISDTLHPVGTYAFQREDEAYQVKITYKVIPDASWQPLTEGIAISYDLTVPALGDDVLKDGVIIIPTDIDLSGATVRVGEGSEEERKTIKDAVDDLIADLEAEGSERSAEDEAIRDKLLELSEALGNESSERESEDVRIYNELINIINELSSESSSGIEEIIHRLDHWYESSEYEGETLEDAIDTINYNIYNLQNTTNNHETRITTLEDIVDSMEHLDYQVMTQEEFDALTEGEKGVIYLVGPVESSEDSAVAGSYVEYIYVNGEFEQIGTTEAQLSQYVRNERLDDFNHSGVSLEEGINELVDQLNEYVTDLTTAINNEVTDRQNADTAEATARQTKDAELESDKVSKSGDTMTGQLVVAQGNTKGIKFTNTGAFPDVTVYADRGWHDTTYDDDYPRITFAGKNNSGSVLLGNIHEPHLDSDAATKQYVDNATAISSTHMVKGVDYVTAGQKSGTTLGTGATAEGRYTTASGSYSHAEGISTTALGNDSHAEGYNTTASATNSHAEGNDTTASGNQSHAEGGVTTASGPASHAEGNGTTASGYASHAEGTYTKAFGSNSHAEGNGTNAQTLSQHVFGEYNVLDVAGTTISRGKYVEIVGNGTADNARSNARTLDWSGNETLAGKLTVGAAPTNDMDVTTKGYVDSNVSALSSEAIKTVQVNGTDLTKISNTVNVPLVDATKDGVAPKVEELETIDGNDLLLSSRGGIVGWRKIEFFELEP